MLFATTIHGRRRYRSATFTGGAVWNSAYLTSESPVEPNDELESSDQTLLDRLREGLVGDIINRIVPPRVESVSIGTTVGDDVPYSIPTTNTENTETDPVLSTLHGEQLRTVPVGKANQIRIRFSDDVDGYYVEKNDLELNGLFGDLVDFNGTTNQAAVDFSFDTATAIWTFSNLDVDGNLIPFPADQYLLTLSDAVVDSARVSLDGEWTNPLTIWDDLDIGSDFPSGNGQRGEDFVFGFTILPGDANRDNVVGRWDALNISAESDTSYNASFQEGDFNGDGQVDEAGDYDGLLRANQFTVFVVWNKKMILGDMDVDMVDVDFDDIDDFVEALFGAYVATHRAEFPGLTDVTIEKIVEQAIGDIDDDGDNDNDDTPLFLHLLNEDEFFYVIPDDLSS